ncbi:MAG: hypothetical protein M3M99_00310 [Actinomycetota bacterium]|nr:hypothetical protein [Actinomycetota bacterium]
MNAPRDERRVPTASEGYRMATRVFAITIIGFGLAIAIVTLARGGGPLSTGLLLGLLFIGLGAGRFYISLRG